MQSIKSFHELKKNLKKDFTGHRDIRIAILGDTSTQFLNQALKGIGHEEGFNFIIYEADYNQIENQILDTSSSLYKFQPEFVIIFQSVQKLQKKFYKTKDKDISKRIISEVSNLYTTLTDNLDTKIIYFNFPELNDGVFCNFANKLQSSFIYQLRKINLELMNLSSNLKSLFIYDFNLINSQFGKDVALDLKIYYTTDIVISLEVLPYVVKQLTDIISSVLGNFKKCLIFDLDNTIWGGIIGDDGIENIHIGDLGLGKIYTDIQIWIQQLKKRGIILAVCSKNNEDIAKKPFLEHPDMILSLEDISIFVANWNNKVDNIKYIQSILNIGFDSMTFIDDNPVERSMVRTYLPKILVPELPTDPSLYLDYLIKTNIFETASYSEEDENRTRQYREEAGRAIAQKSFTNEDDFLISLNMISDVSSFNTFNSPRVAQLSQRSNQFNLRTLRYTEEDVSRLAKSTEHFTFTFNLQDKFGENGLICVVVLKKQSKSLFIENWFMSCRVLKRGMENFVMNTIVDCARENGCTEILGEYIPTIKNSLVKDHYKSLGFGERDNLWHLKVEQYKQKKCFITIKK